MKMKKKPASLESIAKKLDTVDKRFDHIDKRLGGIDARLDSVDKNLGGRIDSLTSIVSELAEATYNGFARVHEVLATKASKEDLTDLGKSVHLDITRLDTRIDKTDENISYLRLKVDDVHEELREFTSDVRDELSGRITVLEKKRA